MSDAELIAQLKAEAQGPFEQHAVALVEGMLKRRAASKVAAPGEPEQAPIQTVGSTTFPKGE